MSGLLLNARYAPFGIAIAPSLTGAPLRRALAAHVVIDESVALALARRDADPQRVFLTTGAVLAAAWVAGTAAGALAGTAIGDPAALGLDVAFLAGFLALLAPLLRMSWLAILALAAGTYALKAVGPLALGGRTLPPRLAEVLAVLPPALLAALVAVQAVGGDGGIRLDARVAGLAVAVAAVWLRAPFLVVLLAGVVMTAGLRALGIG